MTLHSSGVVRASERGDHAYAAINRIIERLGALMKERTATFQSESRSFTVKRRDISRASSPQARRPSSVARALLDWLSGRRPHSTFHSSRFHPEQCGAIVPPRPLP